MKLGPVAYRHSCDSPFFPPSELGQPIGVLHVMTFVSKKGFFTSALFEKALKVEEVFSTYPSCFTISLRINLGMKFACFFSIAGASYVDSRSTWQILKPNKESGGLRFPPFTRVNNGLV